MRTVKYPIAETFGVKAPATFFAVGYPESGNPFVPAKNESYIFRNEYLRDILAFLGNPLGDAFYLTGPTGSGKTSLVHQTAARLNWPVQQVTCHGRMEVNDLIGQFMLSNGTMTFVHGPLATAMREGHILLLNEMDLMDPSELAGLNDVIEGAPLIIPQNGGEVIKPHPDFRLIATGNSAGQGDQSGLFQGVLQQNLALMDRFRVIEVGYPLPQEEKAILVAALQAMGMATDSVLDTIICKMIDLSNEVRKLFVGNDGAGQLTVTMSTRTLVRWLNLTIIYKRAPNALSYSLERALTNRVDVSQREAIHRIAQDIFGEIWEGAQ